MTALESGWEKVVGSASAIDSKADDLVDVDTNSNIHWGGEESEAVVVVVVVVVPWGREEEDIALSMKRNSKLSLECLSFSPYPNINNLEYVQVLN